MSNERIIYNILSTVDSCRSITDIADRLYLSQPYVSKQLHNVEIKYHTKLIARKPLPIKMPVLILTKAMRP